MRTRLVLLVTFACLAAAALGQGISVTVDGRPVAFQGQGPISVSGRVLVPLRGVLEAMGAYVEYRAASRSIYARRGETQIALTLGDRNAVVNGNNVVLDVPAASMGGSTMVPLRFMGESLGADVKWNPDSRTVIITTTAIGGGAVSINSLTHNAGSWVMPGQTIDVRMSGSPGMAATFSITGVVDSVAMRETESGRYEGSWTAPTNREIAISGASIIGSLRSANDTKLLQAAGSVSIDTSPPKIGDFLPEANSRVVRGDVSVSAVFDEKGSGIEESSVRVLVNGQDVTRDATVTSAFTSLRTNRVSLGRNIVAVSARDRAGNSVNKTWEFVVVDAAQVVKSLTHDATGPVQPGDVITVRLEAAPQGVATFSIGQNHDLPMNENPAGVYIGKYTVKRDENLANAAVTAKLVVDGQTFTVEAQNRVSSTGVSGTPPTPTVTAPVAGVVDSPVVVKGTTVRNGTVSITIRYRTKLFGAIPVTGTIFEDVVRANANGNFETEPITLRDPGGDDTTYEISVIAVGDNGKESSPKLITVRRR